MSSICHQKLVRDAERDRFKTSTLFPDAYDFNDLMPSECQVREIDRAKAMPLIESYEWLGTLPANYSHYVGLYCRGTLTGAACFTYVRFGGRFTLLSKPAVCLGRGCCAWWGPKWGASFLIPRALGVLYGEKEPLYVVAFSDWDAGEIGTVYQATNWVYLGHKRAKEYRNESGHRLDINTPRVRACTGFSRKDDPDKRPTREEIHHEHQKLVMCGYKIVDGPIRGKYASVAGKQGAAKRSMWKELRKVGQAYPKRIPCSD